MRACLGCVAVDLISAHPHKCNWLILRCSGEAFPRNPLFVSFVMKSTPALCSTFKPLEGWFRHVISLIVLYEVLCYSTIWLLSSSSAVKLAISSCIVSAANCSSQQSSTWSLGCILLSISLRVMGSSRWTPFNDFKRETWTLKEVYHLCEAFSDSWCLTGNDCFSFWVALNF